MLSDDDVRALMGARHDDPFAVLGMRADTHGRWWLRAVLPGARAVRACRADDGRTLAELALRHPDGLWEGKLALRKTADYRLEVQWHGGTQGRYADAYACPPLIPDADLHFLAEGTHLRPFEVLGAHVIEPGSAPVPASGVRFAVWAPNAHHVSVVGDFNAWDPRRHPMRSRGGSGVWELFVPHAACGDRYKFQITASGGQVLPLKCDPYARQAQLRPDTASVVALPLVPARGLPAARAAANARQAPVSIYEVHLGSWRRHPDGRFHSWDELAAALPDYAASLGFTHIELLPVTEHPFDGSWGYQTLGMYAPTSRFGTPDGLTRFIEACHARGIGVLLDWVPAHFPSDAHGLARFDGSALYEYADPREGYQRDWDTLIYNFGRHEVRNFLAGSALYWSENHAVDGLRVDAVASMLYRDYSREPGQWLPNRHGGRENLEAITLLQHVNAMLGQHAPGAVTVAEESTAYPGVSAPTSAGGLGFHYKWNMGWMHDTLDYFAHEPIHRKYHHDQITFSIWYAFHENFMLPISHDEVVHGKGSLVGKLPGDEWQRFANLRLLLGYMWAHPGKKLLFMGSEFGQTREWNHDTSLDWHLLQFWPHAGAQAWLRDLNGVYKSRPALFGRDFSNDGFEWIDCHDSDESVISFLRRGPNGETMLVVLNATPVFRESYRVGVPFGGNWREVLNSDAPCYGGSGQGNGGGCQAQDWAHHGRDHSLLMNLPPLAVLFFEPA